MHNPPTNRLAILRLFLVRTREGCAEALLENFKTNSVDVVRYKPGNLGFFYGKGAMLDNNHLVFASLWDSIESIQERFGEDWQQSYLPEGYDELILEHSVQHIELSEEGIELDFRKLMRGPMAGI